MAAAAETVVLTEEERAPLMKVLFKRDAAVSRAAEVAGIAAWRCGQGAWSVFGIADVDAASGTGDAAGFGRYLR